MRPVPASPGADDVSLGDVQPRELIVTLYGLYARASRGWLPIAGIVRLMGDLGVGSQAVRSSISRLKRREVLRSERVSGTAGYGLAPAMLEVLREGDRRIFEYRPATLADGWVQVVFTVPETQRERRHELRSRLSGLGFAPVAPGVWVAPGTLAAEVHVTLERRGLDGYVDIFRGEHLGYAPLADRVRQWWDLDAIEAAYAAFVRAYRLPTHRQALSGREAFSVYVRMLTAWRRLRYLDPGLPLELLPARWKGVAAADLFEQFNAVFGPEGAEHAFAIIRTAT